METTEVILPHGARRGEQRRAAVLRPLTGRDEEFLLESEWLLPAARATGLLARCLESLFGLVKVGADDVRGLVFGDREALLLHLRRITFGDRVACVVTCANPSCGSKMDVDLTVSELLRRSTVGTRPTLEAQIEGTDGVWLARFRLPTVGDVEAGAELARHAPGEGADLLLRRCLTAVVHDGGEVAADRLPAALVDAVEEKMLDSDPFAATMLATTCLECGLDLRVPFDAGDYLFRELAGRRRELYEDVHTLAFHYHWSEADILAMTRSRRGLYLQLLAGELGGA